MEKQYSVQFFSTFVDNLQKLCQTLLDFDQLVEVSGYVCVEIDNSKKERYVLSEMVQKCGNVISESYCTKVFRTLARVRTDNTVKVDDSLTPVNSFQFQTPTNGTLPAATCERKHDYIEKENCVQSEMSRVRFNCEGKESIPERNPSINAFHENTSGLAILNVHSLSDGVEHRGPVKENRNYHVSTEQNKWSSAAKMPTDLKMENKNLSVFDSRFTGSKVKLGAVSRERPNLKTLSRSKAADTRPSPNEVSAGNIEGPSGLAISGVVSLQGQGSPNREPVNEQSFDLIQVKEEDVDYDGFVQDTSQAICSDFTVLKDEYFIAEPIGHIIKSSQLGQGSKRKFMQQNPHLPESDTDFMEMTQSIPVVPTKKFAKTDNDDRRMKTTSSRPEGSSFANISSFTASSPSTSAESYPSNLEAASYISGSPNEFSSAAVRSNSESRSSEENDTSCISLIDDDSDEIIEIDFDEDENDEEISDSSGTKEGPVPGLIFPNSAASAGVLKPAHKYQRYALNLFKEFQKQKGEVEPIYTIPPKKLDSLLCDFILGLRKSNGDDFEPSSLKNIQSHLERYLKDASYPYSITKDHAFANSREMLKKKMEELRLKGKGRLSQRISTITEQDIEILFQKNQLGGSCPDALFNTMWFMNNVFFGIKNLPDHYGLRWGDISAGIDEDGREFLEFVGSKVAVRQRAKRVYAKPHNPYRCYVRYYKQYCEYRPENSIHPDAPFYLGVNRYPQGCGVWFTLENASWNRINTTMKRMVTGAGLSSEKRLTNSSAYKSGLFQSSQGGPQICNSGSRSPESLTSSERWGSSNL